MIMHRYYVETSHTPSHAIHAAMQSMQAWLKSDPELVKIIDHSITVTAAELHKITAEEVNVVSTAVVSVFYLTRDKE